MYVARTIVAALVAAALTFPAPSQALAASHQAAGQEKKAETGKKAEKKPAAVAARRHVGTVKAVDPAAGTLTVAEKGGEAEVSITDKTTIKKGKESVKLSDVKPGDEVTVVYAKQDGKDIARSVMLKTK
jgi:Cu/Ag efflux protein CusF